MIKINLLGKKKPVSALPFGLDGVIEKIGMGPEDFAEMRPGLIRLVVLIAGLYVGNFIPNYYHQRKIEELDAVQEQLSQKTQALQRELAAKKDVRKQMDQLNNEESELQRQLNAVNSLEKDRSLAFRTLDNLTASMPAKVWMKKFDYNERHVDVVGSAWEYFPITDFVRLVNESTQYSSVIFKDVMVETSTGAVLRGLPSAVQRIKSFELNFQVKGAGEL